MRGEGLKNFERKPAQWTPQQVAELPKRVVLPEVIKLTVGEVQNRACISTSIAIESGLGEIGREAVNNRPRKERQPDPPSRQSDGFLVTSELLACAGGNGVTSVTPATRRKLDTALKWMVAVREYPKLRQLGNANNRFGRTSISGQPGRWFQSSPLNLICLSNPQTE